MSIRNNIIKLPGLADVHVHLREPGNTHKEDFKSGTKAAVAGGYTQVLDMPNNNPPTVTPGALSQKEKLSYGKIWCDVGFNFGATYASTKYFKKVAGKVFGAKVYMNQTTGPLLVEKLKDRDAIFKSWTSPLPLMVHAEGETVDVAIKLARKYKRIVHICHVTPNQLEAIDRAKKEGLKVTCEVTPHHLFLNKQSFSSNKNDVKRLRAFGIVKPPLLSKRDQEKLWQNLNKIDMISTDHAPHTIEEKKNKTPAFGVPGLETTLSLLFTAIAQGRFSTDKLTEMCATNPRKIFNLPVQKDTFVLVDFSSTYIISADNFFTKNKWTPFEGMPGRGVVKKVVIRGKVVYLDGKFVGKARGKIIRPTS